MKKKLILLLLIIISTGCQKTPNVNGNDNQVQSKTYPETKKEVSSYIDNNKIIVGGYLYHNSTTDRNLLTEYTAIWQHNIDILSVEVFYTNEENISGKNIKYLWQEYRNNYEDVDNYHIGYNISFYENEKHINKTILSPNDVDAELYNYIQIYLYDDINQEDNTIYSHITEEEYNDNSILTSIKLTGSYNTDKITSGIKLTVFTYDNDDFDENNNYRGKSKHTITIKKYNN